MASDDLARLGLKSGASIRVTADGTSLELPVEAKAGVACGTVVIPHGLRDANANALIPSGAHRLEPVSGQHWMTGIPVGVEGLA